MLPSQEEMFGHILRQMPGSCRFRISSSKHSLFQEPATFDVQSLRADRDIRPVCCQVGLLGNRLSPTPRTIMTESQYNSCAARYIWAFKPPFSGVIDTLQPCEGEGALCSLCTPVTLQIVANTSRDHVAQQICSPIAGAMQTGRVANPVANARRGALRCITELVLQQHLRRTGCHQLQP